MADSQRDPINKMQPVGVIGTAIPNARPPNYNQTFYDRMASEYDRSYHPPSKYRDLCTSMETKFILSNIVPNGRTLEVGPGQGRFTQSLAARSAILVAADVSSNMLEICRARTRAANVVYQQTSLFELDEEHLGGMFDTIVAMWIIPHLENPSAAIIKLRSLLKPHGRLVFDLWNSSSLMTRHIVGVGQKEQGVRGERINKRERAYTRYYTYAEMRGLLHHAGLAIVQERGWCLVPVMNYRGARLLFSLYRAIDTLMQCPLKQHFYSRMFSCGHLGTRA